MQFELASGVLDVLGSVSVCICFSDGYDDRICMRDSGLLWQKNREPEEPVERTTVGCSERDTELPAGTIQTLSRGGAKSGHQSNRVESIVRLVQ